MSVLELARTDGGVSVLIDARNAFAMDYLDLLGIPRSNVVSYTADIVLCAKVLVSPNPISCGHAPRGPVGMLQRELRRALPFADDPAARPTVLVVQRPEGKPRSISNIDEVIDAAQGIFGARRARVRLFQPSGHTVAEQAAAFASARVIIAAHGSGLGELLRPSTMLRTRRLLTSTPSQLTSSGPDGERRSSSSWAGNTRISPS